MYGRSVIRTTFRIVSEVVFPATRLPACRVLGNLLPALGLLENRGGTKREPELLGSDSLRRVHLFFFFLLITTSPLPRTLCCFLSGPPHVYEPLLSLRLGGAANAGAAVTTNNATTSRATVRTLSMRFTIFHLLSSVSAFPKENRPPGLKRPFGSRFGIPRASLPGNWLTGLRASSFAYFHVPPGKGSALGASKQLSLKQTF